MNLNVLCECQSMLARPILVHLAQKWLWHQQLLGVS